MKGIFWKVGSGSKIDPWLDPWIPGLQQQTNNPFFNWERLNEDDNIHYVHTLIDFCYWQNHWQWDVHK